MASPRNRNNSPQTFCRATLPRARANEASLKSAPVSNVKVEKVVKAPMKPMSATARASPLMTSLSSASVQMSPKRKHPAMLTAKVLRLSEDLPMVVEIVDEPSKIEGFLPDIDKMVTEGLVTIEKVRVIMYRKGKGG